MIQHVTQDAEIDSFAERDRVRPQELRHALIKYSKKKIVFAALGFILATIIIQGLLYMAIPDEIRCPYKQLPPPPQPSLPPLLQQDQVEQIAQCLTPYKRSFQKSAGEFHYSRVPQQYWEHRIQMVKAMGPTAISTYVMWNYHEVEKGKFDFKSYGKNLTRFLELVKKHKMKVWLRPGPYVCSEWDMGGMSPRLFAYKDMKLRSDNKDFMAETKVYFEALAEVIKPYIGCHNSVIELLQIQNQNGVNEMGSKSYIEGLNKIWDDLGIQTNRYFVDLPNNIKNTYWKGSVIGINHYFTVGKYHQVQTWYPNTTIIGGQTYTGWFLHWRQEFKAPGGEGQAALMRDMLQRDYSFAIYLAHGGTNFALSAGSNEGLKPITTSSDWGAPINEHGMATHQFYLIKRQFERYYYRLGYGQKSKYTIPLMPDPISVIQIRPFTLEVQATILDNIGPPVMTDVNHLFPRYQSNQLQMFHQGIVVYEAWIPKGQYKLRAQAHDYALVWVNGEFVQVIDFSEHWVTEFNFTGSEQKNKILILNQALGHMTYGYGMYRDRKGFEAIQIYSRPKDKNGKPEELKFKWNITTLLVNDTTKLFSFDKVGSSHPFILKAEIQLKEVGDTFLDMRKFGKGYIWVNGHNLGRYWNVGKQYRLYCPGVWLKKGKNDIRLLQLFPVDKNATIQGKKMSDRQQLRKYM